MNEREATDLLHRLAAGVQAVPPPIEHLTEGGRSMRQRRRLRQVVGVAAVTGLALLVGAVVLRPDGGSGPDPAPIAPPQRTADPPTAAAGTRLVGLGQVVVEVPKDWVVAQNGCPRDTGVIFRFPDTAAEAGRLGHCPSTSEDQPYASLAVGSMTSPYGSMVTGSSWWQELEVKGLSMMQSSTQYGPPEFCSPRDARGHQDCQLMFWLLAEDAFFKLAVRGPAARETTLGIRDSIRVLPPGYTTVPFIKPGTSDSDALRRLRDAGLTAELPEVDWPHYVVATEPEAGSVVPRGGTVRLVPGDG